jgi:hypothetical protein
MPASVESTAGLSRNITIKSIRFAQEMGSVFK